MTGSGVRSRHVVVVGGGITGLVAAYRLAKSSNGVPIDVTLLEASRTLGGKLRTIEVGGARVEAGADSFVVRKPWAVDLCKELGLHAQLVIPGASGAFVWVRGRLVPFPEPSAFGIPTTVASWSAGRASPSEGGPALPSTCGDADGVAATRTNRWAHWSPAVWDERRCVRWWRPSWPACTPATRTV